jgi:hypothetical protein
MNHIVKWVEVLLILLLINTLFINNLDVVLMEPYIKELIKKQENK